MTWEVPVEFRGSSVHGMGVFACDAIKKGSIVWRVDRSMHICDKGDLQEYAPDTLHTALLSGYLHYQTEKFVWFTDGMQFMNHKPGILANVFTPDHDGLDEDCIIASRDIQPGDELYEDYGHWNVFNLPRDHWLRLLYLQSCPDHYMFMQHLAEERVAA